MCFRIALVFLLALSALNCGLKIGEAAPKNKPIVVGGAGFTCLSELSEKIDEFLGARMNETEIRQFMSCIRYGFESFGRRTRGSETDSFQPTEIASFLTEYFLKDKKISATLLSDMMIVKKALLGGPIDKVTRGDLIHAIETLKFFEEQAIKLNPYMDLYNFRIGRLWALQNGNPTSRVEEAVSVLREVSVALGNRFAQAAHPYPIESLESLLSEFRSFSGWSKIFPDARPTASWGEFLSAYKAVVTGDDSPYVRPQDWAVLLSSSAGVYGLHIKTKYARSKASLLYGDGLEALIRTGDDLVAIANAAIDRQPKKLISFTLLDRLIDSLPGVGLMPDKPNLAYDWSDEEKKDSSLRASSVKMGVRALFDRILGDDAVPWRSRRSEGLSRVNIGQMVAEFSQWTEIQRFLDRTFKPGDNQSDRLETLSEKLGPIGASDQLMRLMGSKDASSEGMQIVRTIEIQVRPLYRPGDNQVFLTEQSELPRHRVVHGFHNLSLMNVMRGAISLLMRGYSSFKSGEGLFNKGMTEEEMQAFYMDVRDLGVDLGFFDPGSENSGVRAFREANLFTYSGNGILHPRKAPETIADHLTPSEAMEYLAFIYSGGNMGTEIYQAMTNRETGLCRKQSRGAPNSRHGYPMVDRECFARELMAVLLPRLKTMPTLLTELNHATPERRHQVAQEIVETVTANSSSNPKYVEWHEITTLSMILHYTEAVMTRYNRDGDNILNTDEVWDAFVTFENYITVLIQNKCRKQIKGWITGLTCDRMPKHLSAALFAYLVSNGKVPATASDLLSLSLNQFPKAPIVGVKFHVDRTGLLRVFAALVKESVESSNRK